MAFCQGMTGGGGWPLTVVLTPAGKPFFAGTYFPKESGFGRPGMMDLAPLLGRLWRDEREKVLKTAEELERSLAAQVRPAAAPLPGREVIDEVQGELVRLYDPRWGGFGAAPKFPTVPWLLFLLRYAERHGGDGRARVMVEETLRAMRLGGIFDHLGYGFHRYSTDAGWLVPHFEKMLYDNAQLVRSYTEAWQITKNEVYRRVARETCDYVLREMTAPEGGFYSATDADSEGVEGKFFVWTKAEVEGLFEISTEAAAFCDYYDVADRGNWEGRAILNTRFPRAEVAKRHQLGEPELDAIIAKGRCVLYGQRAKRVPPALDDKTLTSWNGLMIGALAEAGRVFAAPRYIEAAHRAAAFLWERHRRDERLLRSSRRGVAQGEAFLEDYAFLANALVDLYEAGVGPDLIWLDRARELAERILELFAARDGGFFSTSRFNETLLLRHREGHDGATPSANGCAALALARLGVHFDRASFRDAAVRAISAYGLAIEKQPRAFPTSLLVLDFLRNGPTEVALVGDPADLRTQALERALGAAFLGQRVIARGHGSTNSAPLLRGKGLVNGRPAVYICRNYACDLPITDPLELRMSLTTSGDRGLS
jgi:hypothetical protein